MPAYRFSWNPFDADTCSGLATAIGYRGDAVGARAYLDAQVKRPDDDFIRATKDVLAKTWLPKYSGVGESIVRELFDRHIGGMGPMPTDAAGFAKYVGTCRNSSGLRDLLLQRLVSFGDQDKMEEGDTVDENFVPRFGSVVPAKQTRRARSPYEHQRAAWQRLDAHLGEAKETGVFKGVLVMPTGSGKTETAVNWLLRRWVNEGGRVLWLAHREELLRQAARTFYQQSGLVSRRDSLRIRIVSTRHCRFYQVDPADDVICCSVNSLARAGVEAKRLLSDKKLFVVIDEAHHAPAKSYRDAIHALEAAGSHRLLGLTATPTRTAERERPELSKLFGQRTLFQVSASELIAQELLARPIPINVKTAINGEQQMTAEDFKHLVDFHEPSAEMLARLGQSAPRNALIAKQYVANKDKYGKTLVFTTDVLGAAQLTHELREQGTNAEYVASYRPDLKEGERVDAREILERFRDPKSGLDVLVNVEMLTEGIDLPMTRTVFLARPTSSEVLLRQMIGRALRGPKAGGNKEAFIVSFEDHWSQYRDYLSPMDLLAADAAPTEAAPKPTKETEAVEAKVGALPPISWDAIMTVSRAIRSRVADADADVFEAVPDGMYVIEQETDGVAVRKVIHVYEHQHSCWEALLTKLASGSFVTSAPDELIENFFGDAAPPRPAAYDVAAVVENARRGGARPAFVPLEGRDECDPRAIAKLVHGKDLRTSEVKDLIAARHTPLARIIYPSALEFRRAFDDAMRELEHEDAAPPPKGVVMFEPPPNNPLREGPHHDLQKLMTETLARGSEILVKPLRYTGALLWTHRIIKGWYGMADFVRGPDHDRIRINKLLNSPDLSAETLRFLLWHEFLHIHLRVLHPPEFRQLEQRWPEYEACNREMDALNEKFGVQYF